MTSLPVYPFRPGIIRFWPGTGTWAGGWNQGGSEAYVAVSSLFGRRLLLAETLWHRVDANGYNCIMLCRRTFRHFVVVAGVLLLAGLSLSAQDAPRRGRKYKAPPPTSRIEVTILRDSDSKPVERASVIFHMVGDTGNMELKTNEDGKAMIDVLPMGSKIRLQVIAKGFQTYGEDLDNDKPELTIGVRLKRPGEQYSIYKDHDQNADAGKDKTAPSGKNSGSGDAAKDKRADSAEPSAQPNASQPQPQ
jgi:hypothetical protein